MSLIDNNAIEKRRRHFLSLLMNYSVTSKVPISKEEEILVEQYKLIISKNANVANISNLVKELILLNDYSITQLDRYMLNIQSMSLDDFNEFILNKDSYHIRALSKVSSKKVEDLSLNYTTKKVPAILRTIGFLGNVFILIGLILWAKNGRERGSLIKIAESLTNYIDIPVDTLRTRISQLTKFILTGDNSQISEGLYLLIRHYKNTNPYKFIKVFNEHEVYTDSQLEKRVKKVLEDPLYLDNCENIKITLKMEY